MSVFRVERTKDYTVMSNYHLKDKRLSLKAKGLLSQMLSLPDDWDYTLAGLASINRESKDAIRSAVNELEAAGYIIRHQTTEKTGKFSTNEYVIYEQPVTDHPSLEKPLSEKPSSEKPTTDNPSTENPTQLNTKISSTKILNTKISNTHSFLSVDQPAQSDPAPEKEGSEAMSAAMIEAYRGVILDNIAYDALSEQYEAYRDDLDEIVELILETVCARRKTTRIAGSNFPHEVVRSRFLKLNSSHIAYVMNCLRKNTTEIRNMKQYLLTSLFNAPATMNNHYTSQVNHDMQAGSW